MLSILVHVGQNFLGALKSRDHIARVDIARLDNAATDQTVVSGHGVSSMHLMAFTRMSP